VNKTILTTSISILLVILGLSSCMTVHLPIQESIAPSEPVPTPEPTTPYPESTPEPTPEPVEPLTANKPSGPSTGEVNQTLTYSTGARSSIAGSPEYRFDWGDGSYSSWSSSVNASHSWASPGIYTIRTKARYGDINSEWSSGKTLVIEAKALPETEKLSRQPMGQPEAMMSYITPEDQQIERAAEDILSGYWRWAYNDFNSLREWVSTHVNYV